MDVISLSAVELQTQLIAGEVTPFDLLDALEARIASVNPHVAALPTLCFDRARDHAAALLQRAPSERGALAGIPVAIKDLADVAGVRSTKGSPIFANNVPERSAPVVSQIEREGGIVYAMTNTPEFGAGASTFNALFATTRNPHDLTKSAAGSSGGSAAALASGMAWLAHGSDLAGSLRNPASFCGVVGLRPSIGRIAADAQDPFNTLSVDGPMARSVADLALFLDAMCVKADDAPISRGLASPQFLRAASQPRRPKRVALSVDFGVTPVEAEVAAAIRAAGDRLSREGVDVVETHPDFSGAHEAFQTLRAVGFAAALKPLYDTQRHLLKPDVVWNIEKGLALSGEDVARAIGVRARITQDAASFMSAYDALIAPATVVTPFPAEQRTVDRVGDAQLSTYIDWLAIAYAVTLTGLPAMSLPCAKTVGGLPIGMQLVGAHGGEAELLSVAAFCEEVFEWDARPVDVAPAASR